MFKAVVVIAVCLLQSPKVRAAVLRAGVPGGRVPPPRRAPSHAVRAAEPSARQVSLADGDPGRQRPTRRPGTASPG